MAPTQFRLNFDSILTQFRLNFDSISTHFRLNLDSSQRIDQTDPNTTSHGSPASLSLDFEPLAPQVFDETPVPELFHFKCLEALNRTPIVGLAETEPWVQHSLLAS